MIINTHNIPDIQILSKILLQAGHNIILPSFHHICNTKTKPDGSIVSETDIAVQNWLANQLAKLTPKIKLLGEEMPEYEQLLSLNSSDYYWCLDPLDGTSNFVAGIPLFSLSLALIKDGHPIIACTVDPVRNESFTAVSGHGAKLNGNPIHCSPVTDPAEAIGFITLKWLDSEMAQHMAINRSFRTMRYIGSSAIEWAWLACGRGAFILHGNEKVWDFAAGSLLASEAGCFHSNFQGESLFPAHSIASTILASCSETVQVHLQREILLSKIPPDQSGCCA